MRFRLDDLPISTKVALPTVILAVVALLCTSIGVWQASQVWDATLTLAGRRSPAEVMSARFNRRLSVMGYAAYRTLALSGDRKVARAAAEEVETAYREGRDSLAQMQKLDPETAPDVAKFGKRFDEVHAIAKLGAEASLQGRTETAKRHLADLDKGLAEISREAKRWGDGYHDDTARIVAETSLRAKIGLAFTLLVGLGSAAAATAFALWLGRRKIAQPIGDLAGLMDQLSTTGELDAPVEVADRLDEVGVMARSFCVFPENAAALREAKAADVAKSEFLANMSHEIRTPLNGVLGMTQVIEAGELSPEQRERVRVVRESGQALLAVLNDILDLSKIEAGKLDLEPRPFDLCRMLSSTCATFSGAAAAKDVELRLSMAPEIEGAWMGDALRLRQVVSNLVSNALKFTEKGHVEVAALRQGGHLVIRIRDTGVGIKPEHLSRLFGKFSQADASTTRRFGGTGLGLSISRGLVEQMGGTIEVASQPGVGSTFTVRALLAKLEQALEPEVEVRPEAMTPIGEDRPLKILAAEDNSVNQLVLRSLLQPLEVELTVVDNGRAAVEAFRTQRFDLILMDIQMPELNGVDATRAIRIIETARKLPPIPILALSANVMTHQLDEYAAAGMQGHVGKPIEAERLYAAIAGVLQEEPELQARSA
jgi:signal transduction histidine kinase